MSVEPATPNAALAAIRAPFLAAKAERVELPILLPLAAVLELVGETVRDELVVVQSDGGEEACLRPDFTLAVARKHLASGAAAGRYLYEGAAFRAPTAEGHEVEEFLQVGVELFGGSADPAKADAELAALAWRAAEAGGRSDLRLAFADVTLFTAFIDSLALAEPLAARLKRAASRPRLLAAEVARAGEAAPEAGGLAGLLGHLSEPQAAKVLTDIWALAGVQPVGGRSAGEIAHRLIAKGAAAAAPALTQVQAEKLSRFIKVEAAPGAVTAEALALAGPTADGLLAVAAAWETRMEVLTAAGVPTDRISLSAAPGRSFDYYDGVRFEVLSQALGARAIAAGGRYDGLLARLDGGRAGRAIGCMVRPWRAFAGGEA